MKENNFLRIENFEKNFNFSELMMPKIINILGQFIFTTNVKLDLQNDVDLLFNRYDGVSVRIRRFKKENFENDIKTFTLRSRTTANAKTQIHKLIQGDVKSKFGFYGFTTPRLKDVLYYTIYDIEKLRQWLISDFNKNVAYYPSAKNKDGTEFKVYYWERIPSDIILFQGYNTLEKEFNERRLLFLNQNK